MANEINEKEYGKTYSDLYDLLTSHKNYKYEAQACNRLIRKHQESTKTMLSIGCGTGSHEISLSKNYRVFGVDTSASMLAVAKSKAKKNQNLDFGNIESCANFIDGNKYDCAISLFNVINCIHKIEDVYHFLSKIYSNLEGILILEIWNGDLAVQTPLQLVERRFKTLKSDLVRTCYPTTLDNGRTVHLDYKTSGTHQGDIFFHNTRQTIRLHSISKIIDALKNIGFEIIEILSALPELRLENDILSKERQLLIVANNKIKF